MNTYYYCLAVILAGSILPGSILLAADEVPISTKFLAASEAVGSVKDHFISEGSSALESKNADRALYAADVLAVLGETEWFLVNWHLIHSYRELAPRSAQTSSELTKLKIFSDICFCQELDLRLGLIDVNSTTSVTLAMLEGQKADADLIVSSLREA